MLSAHGVKNTISASKVTKSHDISGLFIRVSFEPKSVAGLGLSDLILDAA